MAREARGDGAADRPTGPTKLQQATFESRSAYATDRLAARVWQATPCPALITLEGELGSGKSTFARAFIRAALEQAPADAADMDIPSPTFTLVQTYAVTHNGVAAEIWHFDLYRIGDPAELRELDIDEALARAIAIIEWPERLAAPPPDRLQVRFAYVARSADRRLVELIGHGAWADRLPAIVAQADGDGELALVYTGGP